MPLRVIVTGTPGVGKSTVLEELSKLAMQENLKVEIVNFGTVMSRLLEAEGKKLHRDMIRRQDLNLQRRIQLEAAEKIAGMEGEVTIVDTHVAVKTSLGYLPGLPEHVLKRLKPNLIIMVEAEPAEIEERRRRDQDRMRIENEAGEVSTDIEWSRRMAAACSVIAGVPVKTVKNFEGQRLKAAREILSLIMEVHGKDV
ncbi:MAG: adenylate kinase [Candidatus Bathyarchaeia archaeon]|nr:adenylate kinase [Candidatus Bathyarchaeota archaeon]